MSTTTKTEAPEQSTRDYLLKIGFFTIGIYLSFSLNGIFIEKLILEKFQLFYFTQIFITYTLSMIFAQTAAEIYCEPTATKLPAKNALAFAFCLVMGQGLSVFGFSNVSYFVGNLVKSSKTIATVLFAVLMRDWGYIKNIKKNSWLAIVLITIGIISFNVFADASNKKQKVSTTIGFIAIFSALFIESWCNNYQRRTIEQFKPSSLDLMLSISKFGCLISLGISLMMGLEFLRAINYWLVHPKAFMLVLGYSGSAASGQLFIYSMLNNYGPIKLTMVTSSRKMLSVVQSILIFKHPLNTIQMCSIGAIIFSLGLELMEGAKSKPKPAAVENLEKKSIEHDMQDKRRGGDVELQTPKSLEPIPESSNDNNNNSDDDANNIIRRN